MKELSKQHCEVCRVGAPRVEDLEADKLITNIPRWKKFQEDGIERLSREFHFKDFKEAMQFSYKISNLAEHEDHHPSILTEWGKVTICWWTHKIGGLHKNDFIMAAKTDTVAKVTVKV